MTPEILMLCLVGILLGLLALGFWVGLTLGAVGLLGLALFGGEHAATLTGTAIWSGVNSWPLTAMPLFLFMGEILFRSRLADDMFQGLAPWMGRIPGRLLHVNIVGCGILAAIVGSSGVCAATVGRMSLPELRRQGYDEGMMIGTLCGSGTLGLLIPPSIMMIVYGVVGQVSIARLFVAGLVPGLIIMGLFMGYVVIWSLRNPEKVPQAPERLPLLEKFRQSGRLIPTMLLITLVIGSIYGGFATPTEAAVLGVVGALILAWSKGSLDLTTFIKSVEGGVTTTVLIIMILAGASVLSALMDYSSLPHKLAAFVAGLELSTGMLLFGLAVLYLVLGCFLDGVSMIVATTAVVLPMVTAAGVDLVWFGIYLIVLIELAQLTPPIGFNLYILQSLTGKDLMTIAKASLPFFMLLLLTLLILALWPGTVLFLPEMLVGR